MVSSVTLHKGFILHCPAGFPPFQSPYIPCRFGVAFSYYGMSMSLTGFGLNMYFSQFVFGIIEIPAKILMYVLVNRIGRRHSQAWSLILTGLCIGANIIIPTREMLFCCSLKGRYPFCAVLEKEKHRPCPQSTRYRDVFYLQGH